MYDHDIEGMSEVVVGDLVVEGRDAVEEVEDIILFIFRPWGVIVDPF